VEGVGRGPSRLLWGRVLAPAPADASLAEEVACIRGGTSPSVGRTRSVLLLSVALAACDVLFFFLLLVGAAFSLTLFFPPPLVAFFRRARARLPPSSSESETSSEFPSSGYSSWRSRSTNETLLCSGSQKSSIASQIMHPISSRCLLVKCWFAIGPKSAPQKEASRVKEFTMESSR